MNPNLNGEGMQAKIGEETEAIFNQEFWTKQISLRIKWIDKCFFIK